MFIRWKRIQRKPRWIRETGEYEVEPDWSLAAVVVASVRVDGKPRQRFVKHLGSIREHDIEDVRTLRLFWKYIPSELDTLELTAEQRKAFESAILARVPRPSDEEIEAALTGDIGSAHFQSTQNFIRELYGLPPV